MRHAAQNELPYWLEDQAYTKTNYTVEVNDDTYEAWSKNYDAGVIGLGINGFERRGSHYFVGVVPQNDGDTISITNVYPGRHRVTEFKENAVVHQDAFDHRIASMPAFLTSHALIRGVEDRTKDTQLVRVWRTTDYPSSTTPDQIVLTWSGDPKTTQTVQWRTNTEVTEGAVRFKPADSGDVREVTAVQTMLEDPMLVNDAVNHRFTATMTGLEPNSEYSYSVGHGDTWSEWSTFATAPDDIAPFKFVYMGDAQNGLDTWGVLLDKAFDEEPDARFYIMAGDLVNRGIQRDDWDRFFHNATGHYNIKQLVPAIGNHEDQGGDDGPWMYLDIFDLPKNGPDTITKERAYSFEYSNALFVILDTNASVSGQAEWLEEQLSTSGATWKFVVYHHPAYSSAPRRNNPHVRKYWGPLFDKYHVDLAMQGHDHGYLRTYPMYDEKRADSPEDGTIYIVSVSGTKFYEVGDFDYSEFSMSNVSTYQVLDIEIDGNKLHYKSYDIEGELRDEFIIEK
jgi:acid phosphatase type 7